MQTADLTFLLIESVINSTVLRDFVSLFLACGRLRLTSLPVALLRTILPSPLPFRCSSLLGTSADQPRLVLSELLGPKSRSTMVPDRSLIWIHLRILLKVNSKTSMVFFKGKNIGVVCLISEDVYYSFHLQFWVTTYKLYNGHIINMAEFMSFGLFAHSSYRQKYQHWWWSIELMSHFIVIGVSIKEKKKIR